MTEAERAARRLRLELDIDCRMVDAWSQILAADLDDEQEAIVACALRVAYAIGYRDALNEDSLGRRNALARENGYLRI